MVRDDVTETFGDPVVSRWFLDRAGLAQEGWLCPSAPLKQPVGPAVRSDRWLGTVNSAWFYQNWNSYIPSLFRGLERSRGPMEGGPPRAGGYAFNYWLLGNGQVWSIPTAILLPLVQYDREAEIRRPALTPVTADGTDWWVAPRATDLPATNLVRGAEPAGDLVSRGTMGSVAVPRHGSRPARVPTQFPSSQIIPGSINVSFFDGHAESVRLERLWHLDWHRDYEPLARRPGLGVSP